MGSDVAVINSGEETASEVSALLDYHDLLDQDDKGVQHRFFTTGSVSIFQDIAQDWLDIPDMHVEHIKLGNEKGVYQ